MGILDSLKSKKTAVPSTKKVARVSESSEVAVVAAGNSMNNIADRILVRPVFSEKSDLLKEKRQYTFIVSRDANKISVSQAIRELYGVKPQQVRIVNCRGKNVKFGKYSGKEKDVKKAIVTLEAGKSISFGV